MDPEQWHGWKRARLADKRIYPEHYLIVTCAFHAAYSANVRFLIVHGKLTRCLHALKQYISFLEHQFNIFQEKKYFLWQYRMLQGDNSLIFFYFALTGD